jgi:transcriptional regulator with XRE-family HTH domain
MGDDKTEWWRKELAGASPFAEAFGARLREVREARQPSLTTEQVAATARDLGLPWHRTTVGQIERGKRVITAVELLLLPRIYMASLQELLPQGTVWLTDTTAVYAPALWRAAVLTADEFQAPGSWDYLRDAPGRWSTPRGRRLADMDPVQVVRAVEAVMEGPWPKGSAGEHRATPDEAEIKAAARLDTTPHYVAYAARRTWGRGLSAERDARLEERDGQPTNNRGLQAARGHVTRALLRELKPVVQELEQQRNEPSPPVDLEGLGPIRFTFTPRRVDGEADHGER